MMKLLTHPKTMEAMEEIAGQQQADPQQTEGNYFIFKCSIYSNLNLKRRTHLPVAVVPLGPRRDFFVDRINRRSSAESTTNQFNRNSKFFLL